MRQEATLESINCSFLQMQSFITHCVKNQIRVFVGAYRVSIRIQSKYGKIRTRKNYVYGQFSGSDYLYPGYSNLGNIYEMHINLPAIFWKNKVFQVCLGMSCCFWTTRIH